MKNRISAIIPAYHEGKRIEETLKSVKNISDEIIIVHDGPIDNTTLRVVRKYTKKIYEKKHEGRSAFSTAHGLRKARYNWVLKLDADESLSDDLRKNLKGLVKTKEFDGFSFIHPLWDGKKTITKTMPRKTALARKSKISYLGFPGFDMSLKVLGKVKKVGYIVVHKPRINQDIKWAGYREKVLGKYAHDQARQILKNFEDFPTFQYDSDDFPLKIRIRKTLPLFTNLIYAFLVLGKQIFLEKVWKEKPMIQVMLKTFIFNVYLGYLIHKEKRKI